MLLNSTGVISQVATEEESALLRRQVEELNKNTARLIVEAGKLIQESKQLIGTGQISRKPQHEAKVASINALLGHYPTF